MTIYFDKDKNACAFEIENPIASIDDGTWDAYCTTECGKDWDIVDGVFVQYTSLERVMNIRFGESEIQRLKRLLSETDYQAIKFSEGEMTEEEFAPTREQRRQWRAEINRLEAEAGIQNRSGSI